MKFFIQKAFFVSIVGICSINSALAGTTGNFQTNAFLNSSCSIYANDINLGNLNPAVNSAYNASGLMVAWSCSNSVAYTVSLSPGGSGDQLNRKLSSVDSGNTDKVSYQIYLGNMPDMSRPWGDSMNGTAAVTGVGNGDVQGSQIWTKLPLNQFVRPGAYSDTLTITLDY